MSSIIYGIRHHGPGCARSLLAALDAQQPDLIVLESPTELEPLLADANLPGMKPPLAALLYQAGQAQNASFYPFAVFSPEWQAIQWAARHQVQVHCFDLPASIRFALRNAEQEVDLTEPSDSADPDSEESSSEERDSDLRDPFAWLAKADGYSDSERWWNDRIEERSSAPDLFEAILEAVSNLRGELALKESRETLLREAWMRRCLRAVEKGGERNIAVVCGAWHAPVLVNRPKVSEDQKLLKGAPKVKVEGTWVPWTYDRLTMNSGYGAGVHSPGWYEHLWNNPEHLTASWLTRSARILRKHDLEGSTASVIEAVRLANALAGIRGRPRAGLDETLEATTTIFCQGDPTRLRLLDGPQFIGQKTGAVAEGTSRVPLQLDIEAQQRSLRLKISTEQKDLVLDLREKSGRNRSIFFHRIHALGLSWAEKTSARSKGTFKEIWRVSWRPELVLELIDRAPLGNTLQAAAASKLLQQDESCTLEELSQRLESSLLAELPEASTELLKRLDALAAQASDVLDLLSSIPYLARTSKYGDVRDSNSEAVVQILEHVATRVHLALPACMNQIDNHAAEIIGERLRQHHAALLLVDRKELLDGLYLSLHQISLQDTAHALPRGCCCRILRDASRLEEDEVERLISRALSVANEPQSSAAWLEGFLAGNGSVLVHDLPLLGLIHSWLAALQEEAFQHVLPLLRRSFSSFSPPERQRIGAAVQQDLHGHQRKEDQRNDLDLKRSTAAVAFVSALLQLGTPKDPS